MCDHSITVMPLFHLHPEEKLVRPYRHIVVTLSQNPTALIILIIIKI